MAKFQTSLIKPKHSAIRCIILVCPSGHSLSSEIGTIFIDGAITKKIRIKISTQSHLEYKINKI